MARSLKPTEKRKLQRQQDRRKQPDEPKRTKRVVEVTITLLFDEPLTIEAIEAWDAKFDSIDKVAQDAGYTLAEILSCTAWSAEIREQIEGIDD